MTEENAIEKTNEEVLQMAKQLSGEFSGIKVPFIPILKINNTKEKKIVDIEGVKKEVELAAKKGFNVTTKGENGYDTVFFGETLKGGFLKQRYSVKSKYKSEPGFYSREFDDFNEKINLINPQDKNDIVASGTYKDLKEMFQTGETNSMGKPKSNLILSMIIYIEVEEKIYRLELSTSSKNNWFDYKNSFGDNETIAGFETIIGLKEDTNGSITYWYSEATRGETLDLAVQLKKQMELAKFITDIKGAYSKKPNLDFPDTDFSVEPKTIGEAAQGVIDGDDDIKIENIPF